MSDGKVYRKGHNKEAYVGLATDGQPQDLRVASTFLQEVANNEVSMATYHFDTEDAVNYGVDGAIILYNLCFWIAKNKANKNNLHEGRYWTYNSAQAFTELFPFWNRQKIARILRKLEEKGAIRSSNFNDAGYDKTKWYTVLNSACLKSNIGAFKSGQALSKNEQPIPDEKQHIENTDNICGSPSAPACKKGMSGSEESGNQCKRPEAQKSERAAPPEWDEVYSWSLQWAEKNNKPHQAVIAQAKKAFAFYEANMKDLGARTWKDSNGKTVKSWKLKMARNWFTDDKLASEESVDDIFKRATGGE